MTKHATIFPLLCLLLCFSCAPGIRLNTQEVTDSQVTGAYELILYGCNFNNDLETIAFLQKEGARYKFEPYAPDFSYKTKKGVPAKEALQEARDFVNCSTSFSRSQLSSIVGPDGDILGYEVRPLYHPFTYGVDDVLNTYYRLKGDRVVITVRLIPSVETMLQDGGPGEREK